MGLGIRRIKACLNGGRRPYEHPAVPITANELASAAVDAVAAGAEALHLHPRDSVGAETLHLDHVAAAVTAVRRACPGVPVGVSTGLWISDGDVGRRLASVAGWADLPVAARPDFASVNISEAGFAELVETLLRARVGVEAWVWSTADAQELAAFGAAGWTRVLEARDVGDAVSESQSWAVLHPAPKHSRWRVCLPGWAGVVASWPVGLLTGDGLVIVCR